MCIVQWHVAVSVECEKLPASNAAGSVLSQVSLQQKNGINSLAGFAATMSLFMATTSCHDE
jgi:hypothetical protein